MIQLAPLEQADPADVEQLLDAAFGRDRHGRTAYRLREGVDPIGRLSLAAFDADDRLAGSLQSWPIQVAPPEGGAVPLVLIGPVAVAPALQRRGLGRTMMDHVLACADRFGEPPQVLIGDPEYYGRFFGFTADATSGWAMPGPFERRRLLARSGGRSMPVQGMLEPRR